MTGGGRGQSPEFRKSSLAHATPSARRSRFVVRSRAGVARGQSPPRRAKSASMRKVVSVCEPFRMGTTPRAGNAARAACSMRVRVRRRRFGMLTHLPALFGLIGLAAGARRGGRASRRRGVLLAGVRTRGGVGHHRRGLGELPSLRAGRHRAERVPLRRRQHAARLLGAHVRVHALCEAIYGDLRGSGVREFERTPRRAMCAGRDAALGKRRVKRDAASRRTCTRRRKLPYDAVRNLRPRADGVGRP